MPAPVELVGWGEKVTAAVHRLEALAYVGVFGLAVVIFCLAWIAVAVSFRK